MIPIAHYVLLGASIGSAAFALGYFVGWRRGAREAFSTSRAWSERVLEYMARKHGDEAAEAYLEALQSTLPGISR